MITGGKTRSKRRKTRQGCHVSGGRSGRQEPGLRGQTVAIGTLLSHRLPDSRSETEETLNPSPPTFPCVGAASPKLISLAVPCPRVRRTRRRCPRQGECARIQHGSNTENNRDPNGIQSAIPPSLRVRSARIRGDYLAAGACLWDGSYVRCAHYLDGTLDGLRKTHRTLQKRYCQAFRCNRQFPVVRERAGDLAQRGGSSRSADIGGRVVAIAHSAKTIGLLENELIVRMPSRSGRNGTSVIRLSCPSETKGARQPGWAKIPASVNYEQTSYGYETFATGRIAVRTTSCAIPAGARAPGNT